MQASFLELQSPAKTWHLACRPHTMWLTACNIHISNGDDIKQIHFEATEEVVCPMCVRKARAFAKAQGITDMPTMPKLKRKKKTDDVDYDMGGLR